MSINQVDRIRGAIPPGWRRGQIGNLFNQIIDALQQTAASTGEGGDTGDTVVINQAESDIISTVARVQDAEARIEGLERNFGEPNNDDIESRIDDLERQLIDLWTGQESGFKSTAVDGGVHEATDREFITASLSATILLPSRPVSDSVIIVKKIDNSSVVKIGGNNKTVDGNSIISIRRKNTSLVIQYDIERDGWFIR